VRIGRGFTLGSRFLLRCVSPHMALHFIRRSAASYPLFEQ
jgi:hypothetical protein